MQAALGNLRQFSFAMVLLRLGLAMLSGGVVGYGRSKKARPAGLRTYMLISLGATMAVLLTLYEYEMLKDPWADVVAEVGMKFDASRLASQAITGIGFLGAGIIVKIAHQQVNGLTTATGLFATVVMGIAAGAGFYECVLVALLMIVVVLNVMSPLEITFKRRLRNITLNVEFTSVDDIATITKVIEGQQARVYDIDIERTERKEETWFFKLGSGIQHAPEYAVELLNNDKNSLDQVLRFCKDNRMAITNLKIQTVSEDVNAKYAAGVSLRGGIAQSALLDQVQRMPGIVSAMGL